MVAYTTNGLGYQPVLVGAAHQLGRVVWLLAIGRWLLALVATSLVVALLLPGS